MCGASTGTDFGLAVFSGTCAALVVEACNDNTCGTNPVVQFLAQPGSTYLIMVAAANASPGGLFTFTLTHTSASTTTSGTGCPVPTLLTTTLPVIGQPAAINLISPSTPNATGILLISATPAAVPLLIPPSGCPLYLNPVGIGLFTTFTTNGSGVWSIGAVVPNDPALECLTATFQALVAAPVPGGFAFSSGVNIVIGY
jgi:hypothetical protein